MTRHPRFENECCLSPWTSLTIQTIGLRNKDSEANFATQTDCWAREPFWLSSFLLAADFKKSKLALFLVDFRLGSHTCAAEVEAGDFKRTCAFAETAFDACNRTRAALTAGHDQDLDCDSGRIKWPESLISSRRMRLPGLNLYSIPPGPGKINAGVLVSTTASFALSDLRPRRGGSELSGATGAVYVPRIT